MDVRSSVCIGQHGVTLIACCNASFLSSWILSFCPSYSSSSPRHCIILSIAWATRRKSPVYSTLKDMESFVISSGKGPCDMLNTLYAGIHTGPICSKVTFHVTTELVHVEAVKHYDIEVWMFHLRVITDSSLTYGQRGQLFPWSLVAVSDQAC